MTTLTGPFVGDRIISVPDLPVPTLRQWERLYVTLALLGDMTAGGIAGGLAFAVARLRDPSNVAAYAVETIVLPIALVVAIALAGGYERRFMGIGPEEFRRMSLGALGLAASAGFLSWATNMQVARSYVVVALPTALVLTGIVRFALRKWVHRQRGRGRFTSRTVVIGPLSSVTELGGHLSRQHYHGYNVVATCLTPTVDDDVRESARGPDVLERVPACVREHRADTVVVAPGSGLEDGTLRRLCWVLEETGANVVVAPSLMESAGPRLAVRPVDGLPLLHLEHPRFTGIRRLVKGLYDPVAAALIAALLSPLLVVIAIAIKLDSPGPVLFRQERIGRLGKPFRIFKFRTMVCDADQRKAEIAHLNEGAGPLFKVLIDPRVTRVGSFLRRTSLDELPQLFNVIIGEMSLVGPRPHLHDEIVAFGRDFSRRLFVKPGMTGLWQVSGRSDLTFEESIRLDLRYVENWTLALDVFIMWKTLGVMLNRSGAY